ncbi:MAG: hypothetical protein DMF81_12790 [Acidobacteria bacterium]|nr:MAG: hypothetical protein DMF81_12790 [Acidobacteriota bacterium]
MVALIHAVGDHRCRRGPGPARRPHCAGPGRPRPQPLRSALRHAGGRVAVRPGAEPDGVQQPVGAHERPARDLDRDPGAPHLRAHRLHDQHRPAAAGARDRGGVRVGRHEVPGPGDPDHRARAGAAGQRRRSHPGPRRHHVLAVPGPAGGDQRPAQVRRGQPGGPGEPSRQAGRSDRAGGREVPRPPARSERASSDWVIKDDLYAVWVSGRKPKGPGWELDASLKRDTGKWIEVVGRPETRNGVTYIKAMQVRITDPPRPTADAAPPPPPPERPKVPPVVVFALPLDGEGDVPSDSRFVVQFNKDMDEATFKDHVMLRYVGPVLPGDREFDGVKLSYDQGRRALTVDPGDVLRPGRQIELMLLPGISDLDGLTLVARPGKQFDGAADVLRFRVGT